ncbi:hypothetical protein BJX64DRAFT_57905 [Aspergillus heterothallicus]
MPRLAHPETKKMCESFCLKRPNCLIFKVTFESELLANQRLSRESRPKLQLLPSKIASGVVNRTICPAVMLPLRVGSFSSPLCMALAPASCPAFLRQAQLHHSTQRCRQGFDAANDLDGQGQSSGLTCVQLHSARHKFRTSAGKFTLGPPKVQLIPALQLAAHLPL